MKENRNRWVLVVTVIVFAVLLIGCQNPAGGGGRNDDDTAENDGTERDTEGEGDLNDGRDVVTGEEDAAGADTDDNTDTEDSTDNEDSTHTDEGTDNHSDSGTDTNDGPGDSPEGSDGESEPEGDPDDGDPEPEDSPDDGNDTGEDTGDTSETGAITISFDDPDDPEIIFSGGGEEVLKGDEVVITPGGSYTGHTWYLNGSTSHAGLSTDGATATINTNDLSYGTHSVSLVVAEGYSAQFTFDVVDTVTQ